MDHRGKALDLSRGENGESDASQPSAATSSPAASASAPPDVDNLTTFELLYELYKESHLEVLGSPKSAFATFEPQLDRLCVFPREDRFMNIIPYRTDGVLAALSCAQANGASFSVSGEDVICVIDDVSARGASYGDAALRALIKCERKVNEEEAAASTEALIGK